MMNSIELTEAQAVGLRAVAEAQDTMPESIVGTMVSGYIAWAVQNDPKLARKVAAAYESLELQ